jgi:3-methylcrotonyl-CoA carboxylase beta subunit
MRAVRSFRAVAKRATAVGARCYGTTPETMNVLPSGVDVRSEDFKKNSEEMERLTKELRERLNIVRQGGGKKAVEKHTARGKLFVRDRINGLLDPGSPFLELSPLAAWNLYGESENVPSGGIVTGIGRVHG